MKRVPVQWRVEVRSTEGGRYSGVLIKTSGVRATSERAEIGWTMDRQGVLWTERGVGPVLHERILSAIQQHKENPSE